LNLHQVIFVPSHQTPLKKKETLLPARLRLSLLERAVKRHAKFSVSATEVRRKGVSYTVDTLRALRKKYGRRAQLYFLAGADSVKNFSRWKSPSEVLKLCRFVVLTRPGSRLRPKDKRFLWLPMPPVDISSSDIRKKLKRAQKIKDLIPNEIEKVLQGRERNRR
jgi:nicotinate-nucleotide adenylyltransferase